MNKMIIKLQEYALTKDISRFYLYSEIPGMHEYTDKIEESDLGRLLAGNTFRNEKTLMEELMPEIVLDDSSQLLSVTSSFVYHFANHPDVAVEFFKNNAHLLQDFSLKNKETYYWLKSWLKENIVLLDGIFEKVLLPQSDLLTKKESITYCIDHDKIVEASKRVFFYVVEKSIEDSLSAFTDKTYEKLKVSSIIYHVKRCSTEICFIEVRDKDLLDNFMHEWLNFIIDNIYKTSTIEDIHKLIDYTYLQYTLENKGQTCIKKI